METAEAQNKDEELAHWSLFPCHLGFWGGGAPVVFLIVSYLASSPWLLTGGVTLPFLDLHACVCQ